VVLLLLLLLLLLLKEVEEGDEGCCLSLICWENRLDGLDPCLDFVIAEMGKQGRKGGGRREGGRGRKEGMGEPVAVFRT